ncbi:MAG: DNRLRE domain-containing protein [Chromatiales bacterium]|jgi:hypothetical protein
MLELKKLFHRPLSVATVTVLLGFLSSAAFANETLIYQVNSGADDAEEKLTDPGNVGEIDLTSSDLELTWEDEEGDVTSQQRVGVRFTGIDIPKGTPILGAYLQFSTDEDDKNGNPFNVTIWAEASDDTTAFTNDLYNVTSRPMTGASVAWNSPVDWTVEHASGPAQRTPDLSLLVQEIVNRDGWSAGNAMTFLLEGTGTRTAESYEGSISHTGLNGLAARLVIVVPTSVTYQVSSADSDSEERLSNGEMDWNSSDLELGSEDGTSEYDQAVGVRFAGVAIPKGAQILSASIQFTQDNTKNNNPFNVTIWGEDTPSSEPYSAAAYNISTRSKTDASVAWSDIPDWTVTHEAGENQRTPDLTALVQEIVNRDGWTEGNALAFIIEGTGTREAESFEGGGTNYAARLNVSFIGELASASVDKIRLSWSDDPTSTMTVIWDQLRGVEPAVHYDEYNGSDCSTDLDAYTNQQPPQRVTPALGMQNTIARLTGLSPNTAYRFVVADSENVSECMWFKTAPATSMPFTYISGGDTKSSGNALQAGRWSNQMVAKLRPLFVFFTGDFNSGNGLQAGDWQQWLTDWSTLTKSSDGRMYPIIAVHGNHEDGDFEVLWKLFDSGNMDLAQSDNYSYYALSFGGDLLRVYNLNSQLYLNGMSAAHDQQTAWFEQDLQAHTGTALKVTGYHKPMRPHTRSKAENNFLVNDWAPLFDSYDVAIANESDTHNHVFTFPIRLAGNGEAGDMDFVRDDLNGTLHVGEGSWGATPRANDDDKSWTLDSAAMNQLKWNWVFPATTDKPARIEIRSVKTAAYVDGEFTNFVEGVAENTEANVFAYPAGLTLHSVPFYGDHIQYPFEAVDGDAPAAPQSLVGNATSYFDISITWTNVADPSLVRTLQVERKQGDGDWVQLSGSLSPDTTSYDDANLSDGTAYTYRVRATNIFGSSDWSNEVTVVTPSDPRVKSEFQEGVDGYQGTLSLAIASASPDQAFARAELSIDQATSDYGADGMAHGLIKFEGLFGADGVPANAIISSAELRFRTSSSTNGPVALHRLLQAWDASTSWNAFGGNGVDTDDAEALGEADDAKANLGGGEFAYFDVTASVLAWAGGEPNHGWAIINSSTDGWDFETELFSGAAERRPLLTVYYTLAGDADSNGEVNNADLTAMRPYLRSDASACPACDMDGNGVIDISDMRRLMILIRTGS